MPSESPQPLRFDCPACQASLTVPAAAAGVQGPCPKCWKEIVSPDPANGRLAHLPQVLAPPPAAAEPPAPPKPAAPSIPPSPAQADPPAEPPEPTEPKAKTEVLAPPIPEETRATTPRRSALPLAIAFMLTALVFAVGGFFVGRSDAPSNEDDLVANDPPAPSQATPSVDPEESEQAEALPSEKPAELPSLQDPLGSLQAFLDAKTWDQRAEFVLWPGDIGGAMKKHATDFGDGPIHVDSITLLEVVGPNHIFKVCTPRIPEGYPVAVSKTDEGYMIDWESFIGFHEDHFKDFIEGPAGRSGIFDLLVKPDPNETEAGNFIRYILSVPMPDRTTTAYIRKDSVACAKLLALFDGANGFDEEALVRLKESGVPVVLAVAKRETEDGRSYFEIEDFVAVGWGPAGR